MTDLPKPNIPLLRKAVEWAEAEAAKTDGTCLWNQQFWAVRTDCGTAYCIAGYTVAIAHPEAEITPGNPYLSYGDLEINGGFASWPDTARSLLGLTEDERWELFDDTNSIADVRRIAEQIAARAGERL